MNNYIIKEFSDFSGSASGISSGRDLGNFRIYLNQPRLEVTSKWSRGDYRFTLGIGHISPVDFFTNYDTGNYESFKINYDFKTGTVNPSNIFSSSTKTINPLLPVDTEYTYNQKPSVYSSFTFPKVTVIKQENSDRFLGISDKETFSQNFKIRYIDNLFNSQIPAFSISGNNVVIELTNYRPGGEFVGPITNLVKTGISILNENTDDILPFTASTRSYILPWVESNTYRTYTFQTYIPEPENNSGSNLVSFEYDGIYMYNDQINFKTLTLSTVSGLKRTGNILRWNSVSNAGTYNIYKDNVLVDTVTGNAWQIPEEFYNDEIHSYSISVNDNISTTYFYDIVNGKYRTTNISGNVYDTELYGGFPSSRNTYVSIYKGSTTKVTHSSWTNVGVLSTPTVRLVKDKLNQYTINLSHTSKMDNTYFYIQDNIGNNSFTTYNNSITFSNLTVSTEYNYTIKVAVQKNGEIFYSTGATVSFTPTKYPIPSINSVTKSDINAYQIKFSSTVKPDRYDVYLNDVIFKSNATSPLIVSGFTANTANKVTIESVFEEDSSYNSSTVRIFNSTFSRSLSEPTLSKRDIKENNIEQTFGEGNNEILNNITTKVELNWNAIQYASGYMIYEIYREWDNDIQDWTAGERTYPTQTNTPGTEYMTSTSHIIEMSNVIGYHNYYVKAIFANDEDYNSGMSNGISLEQNFPLEAPVIDGYNNSTTISFDEVENADFYSIQLVPTRGTTENIFRSFIPEAYPFSYNYYDLVKDLTETETFMVSVFSRSYNAFYFHPSENSNIKVLDVYKLNTPVNLQIDNTTETLTWTGDSRAYKYEINIKASDGQWVQYFTTDTSYAFTGLAPSLYTIYIRALRNDSLTNNNPVYLSSERSANLTFGHLNTPQDFERNVNVFSWTSVGADRYIFYEDGRSITTVDGGGSSLSLGMVSGERYRPTEGVHTYNVKASTMIDGELWESFLSEDITVNITYLNQLTAGYINQYESLVEWEILDTNVLYDTRVNNIAESDLINDNLYSLDKNEAGIYKFKVRPVSIIDSFLYQTPEWSNEVIYNVIQLARPEISLSIVEDNNTGLDEYIFSWEPIANASRYTITINRDGNEIEHVVSNAYYSMFPEAGNYTIKVVAMGSLMMNPNPKYLDSNSSNIIKFGKLEAPVISIDENVITWEADPLADYYEIYNYGEYFSQIEESQFVLDVSKPYSYNISIKAISNEELVMDSDRSNSVQYVIVQLGTPQNVKLVDGTLKWDIVLNADAYRIYIDDVLTTITSRTEINLGNILSEMAGIIKIHVTAISNEINYLESESSNYILKRIEKQKKFNIVIDGVNYDKIQLPFSIHETLDETLDEAGITLAYVDRSEPFERLTPAAIIIYEGNNVSKSYKMVIESDDVSEVQIGTEIRYKHTLQLIERTILIQNEIIPDFTITTPITDLTIHRNELINASKGNNTIPGRDTSTFNIKDINEFAKNIVATGTYNEYTININGPLGWLLNKLNINTSVTMPLGFVFFLGIGSNNIKGSIEKSYQVGDQIPLPVPSSRLACFNFSIQEIFFEYIENLGTGMLYDLIRSIIQAVRGEVPWWEVLVYFLTPTLLPEFATIADTLYEGTKTDNDWPFPPRNYYIRPHKAYYEKSLDETLINSFPAQLSLQNTAYTFNREGNYDLIMEIPTVNFQALNDNGMLGFAGKWENWFSDEGEQTLATNVNFMKDSNGNPTTFRLVWSDIDVFRKSNNFRPRMISDVLEKAVSLTNGKYTLDPVIKSLTSTKVSPDFTFSNGNYLYDVLETIGREFSGIPRVLESNIITFDILDEYTAASRNINNWIDDDVLGAKSQELEKVSSGFISRVSNMVPDDDYTIYPAPNMWQYARGEKNVSATVDLTTLAIAVDKPIYKIKQILVKNAIKELPEFEIDLTPFTYQDVVYDSLNDNRYGKGMALVWGQGSKYIRGLGQLPEASKLYAQLDFASDDYVIENIIQYYISKNLSLTTSEIYHVNNPNDMLFRVQYQGYTDTTIYVENSDKRNNKYDMYTVFNQEDNTISDTRFGHSALTQLKRHGGNIIQKTYKDYTLMNVPLLGTSIEVDNTAYYMDEIKYTFHNSYIESAVSFTKNYNKINPRLAVNSEYRQYQLKDDNVVNRIVNFNQYCYIGNFVENNENSSFYTWRDTLRNSLNGDTTNKPDSFYFNCYNSNNLDKISYLTSDDNGEYIYKNIDGIAKPVSYNKIGTSIMFSTNMDDNFTAGQTIRRKTNNPKNLTMLQSFVRYVGDDSTDQVPYMRVTIGSLPGSIKNTALATYPSVNWLSQPTISMNNPYFSRMFKVYKDQRETLGFNYQMHFISNDENIFIHKGLTKYMFKNPGDTAREISPIFVAYSDFIGNKDILDVPYEKIGDLTVSSQNLRIINKINPTNNSLGIALIWPDTKEIILEIRQKLEKDKPFTLNSIYFNFSNKILK